MEDSRVTTKHDELKPRFELIEPLTELALAALLTLGAIKYAEGGWKALEKEERRIHAALRRHQNALLRGEFWDDETGFPHAICMHANTMFLSYWAMKRALLQPGKDGHAVGLDLFMSNFEAKARELKEKYGARTV